MQKQVMTTITEHNMLVHGDGIVIGLSGGADSVALTHFLRNLTNFDFKIVCVHIHHGLRGDEADRDARFCEDFCKQLDVDLIVFKKDAAAKAQEIGVSVEEAGRILRYSCFNDVLQKRGYDKIAVAHNLNDMAETVIMQTMRGAGGIRGIPATNGNIIRPLIDITREAILAYCERHGLLYCTDSTNEANDYTRNWIRNVLLPQIADNLNPSAPYALQRLAKISAEEDTFLYNIAKNASAKCIKSSEIDIIIDLNELGKHDIAIKRRIMHLALAEVFGSERDITFGHVESVLSLASSRSGKRVSLPKGFVAEKMYHEICIKIPDTAQDFSIVLPIDTPIYVSQIDAWIHLGNNIVRENAFTKALDCGKITDVLIRTRLPGDKIRFSGVGTKKIKDFLIDKKIPRGLRETAVFIACKQDIILIMGEGFEKPIDSHKFDPENDSNTIYLQVWNEK